MSEEILWITFINYGYLDFCKNFLISMKKENVKMKLIIYCSLDCIDELKEYDNCICIDSSVFITTTVSSTLVTWGEKEYIKLTFLKLNAILYTLKNYDVPYVGFIDTDIIVLKHPTEVIMKKFHMYPSIKIISQCDQSHFCTDMFKCPTICSGAIVFKNDPTLYPLFEYDNNAYHHFTGDQNYLIAKIKEYDIPYLTIEKDVFISGYDILNKKEAIFPENACLLHFNCLIGLQKVDEMKRLRYWYL